ncbi:MAG TPA: hypothetical protein VJ716_04155 [Gaiellaceae bacterium]|nr:hypothetical protein [Gaiellaceae bacterium]
MPARYAAALALLVSAVLLLPTAAAARKPPKGGGGGGGSGGGAPSTTSTYVKNYANVVNGVQYDLSPVDVQATPDGGSIALATTYAPPPSGAGTGPGVSWLLKRNAVGAPQWQEEVGCPGTPPGAYSDTLSLQLTSDGGYVIAGGTIGCGSGDDCPALSGIQCGLVERLDAAGQLEWARVYAGGANGAEFDAIAPTADGGFVAAGSTSDASHDLGGLIVKLDGAGNVQWQRALGRTGNDQVYLHDVRQTSDGGYIAAGQLHDGSTSDDGEPFESALAVKLDAAGNVSWLHAYNDVGSGGGVAAATHAFTIVQTADGGYAIGGNWSTGQYLGRSGALLLRLSANGSIQSQTAYSGGLYCLDSETCTPIGGVVNSVHQTADGGFVLAGDADLIQGGELGLAPWLAKVDGGGAVVWQEQDYQSLASTGAALSEDFAASALTSVGPLAVGRTENYANGLGELLGVQTDATGAVGSCSQVHPGSPLSAVDPGLTELTPAVTATTPTASQSSSPAVTTATSANATAAQC